MRTQLKIGDWVFIAAMVAAFAVFVRYYAKALADVRCGRLIVYLGWGDFFKSVAWVVAVPFGLAWTFGSDGSNLFVPVIGLIVTGFGVKSFVRMCRVVFKSGKFVVSKSGMDFSLFSPSDWS